MYLPMTEEDLHITYNLANEPGLGATAYRTRQMIAEILRHRAAKAADAERIRKNVAWAISELAGPSVTKIDLDHREAVADRVAEQLATPSVQLSICESGALKTLLREPVMDEYPMAHAAIERLIAAHGENQ